MNAGLQAQSDVIHLHSELAAALSQQDALQSALQELQATIAVLQTQIQHEASAASASDDTHHRLQPGMHRQRDATLDNDRTSDLVKARQQQVADLKTLSSLLDHQQQPDQDPATCSAQAAAQQSSTGTSRGQTPDQPVQYASARQPYQKHDCLMPPPPVRSLPSRRLPMSAYASPVSSPQVQQSGTIRAHHPAQQAAALPGASPGADDRCWCGRTKMTSKSVMNTPVRSSIAIAQQLHSLQKQGKAANPLAFASTSGASNARYVHSVNVTHAKSTSCSLCCLQQTARLQNA